MNRPIKILKEEIEEIRKNRIQGRKPKIKEQYMQYLQNLSPDEAFKLKIKDTKEGYAIRNRINRAAKALDVDVHIEKVGNTILFYVL